MLYLRLVYPRVGYGQIDISSGHVHGELHYNVSDTEGTRTLFVAITVSVFIE